MNQGEQVLVVPRAMLFEGVDTPHGFSNEHLSLLVRRIEQGAFFKDRGAVEEDPSLKQIIPYMMVTDGERVYLLKRLETQTEARLRNLFSIGVGGHINPVDDDGGDVLNAGLARELEEELSLAAEPDIAPLGTLNDESNAVGSVHFGLVYRVRLPASAVSVREHDKMEGRFATLDELADLRPTMETWSQLLLDHILNHRDALLTEEV